MVRPDGEYGYIRQGVSCEAAHGGADHVVEVGRHYAVGRNRNRMSAREHPMDQV
jgi:hypothetical protein